MAESLLGLPYMRTATQHAWCQQRRLLLTPTKWSTTVGRRQLTPFTIPCRKVARQPGHQQPEWTLSFAGQSCSAARLSRYWLI